MTKELPPGTRNMAFNAPEPFWQEFLKAAYSEGKSGVAYFREHFIAGLALKDPAKAARLRDLLRAGQSLTLLAFGLFVSWQSMQMDSGKCLRAPLRHGPKIVRSVRAGRKSEIET